MTDHFNATIRAGLYADASEFSAYRTLRIADYESLL